MFVSKLLTTAAGLAGFCAAAPTLENRATGRTSAPSGCISVQAGKSGNGFYPTISAAVASLSGTASACIFIYNGVYKEQVVVTYGGPLTIYGYTTDISSYKSNAVTITNSLSSPAVGNLDASSTLQVKSANFKLYNVNVANTYGQGAQAVAVTANGDKQGYYGCSFKSYQDTLYAKAGYQYYSNCYIEGAVDYVFGNAAAWFGECVLASNGGGAITASSREKSDDPNWYVIDHSTVTASSSVSSGSVKGKVYLGRPWRVLARVIYQYSTLTDVVNSKGWTTMAEGATPLYYEYSNTGASASTSSRQFLTKTSAATTKSQLWPKGYDWIDKVY